MQIQPYLFFDGSCEQALQFYQAALGAKVELMMRYKDNPEPPPPGMVPPGYGDKVMHASLRIGDNVVMAADDCTGGSPRPQGFALSVSGGDQADAQRRFDALSQGGQVMMPLQKTFWAPAFGMLRDRFGVHWMVSADH